MDAQNTPNEQNYTKDFNAGYLLARHEAELLNQILATKQDKETFIAQIKHAQQKNNNREREGR